MKCCETVRGMRARFLAQHDRNVITQHPQPLVNAIHALSAQLTAELQMFQTHYHFDECMHNDPQYRGWAFSLLERAMYNHFQVATLLVSAIRGLIPTEFMWIGKSLLDSTFEEQKRVLNLFRPLRHFRSLHRGDYRSDVCTHTSSAQPPVLLNPDTNEPIERAECPICMERPVEVRSQGLIGTDRSLNPSIHAIIPIAMTAGMRFTWSSSRVHCAENSQYHNASSWVGLPIIPKGYINKQNAPNIILFCKKRKCRDMTGTIPPSWVTLWAP